MTTSIGNTSFRSQEWPINGSSEIIQQGHVSESEKPADGDNCFVSKPIQESQRRSLEIENQTHSIPVDNASEEKTSYNALLKVETESHKNDPLQPPTTSKTLQPVVVVVKPEDQSFNFILIS